MLIQNTPVKVGIKGYKRDDCTVVALGNSLGVSYDLARKILQTYLTSNEDGNIHFRKNRPLSKSEFHLMTHVESVCGALSVETKLFGGKNKKTLAEFAKEFNKGIYIVLVSRHLTTVIDGNIVDSWDSSGRMVVYSYKVNLEVARKRIMDLATFYRMNNEKHIFEKHIDKILSNVA